MRRGLRIDASYWLIALMTLSWGCGEEATTPPDEESKVVDDDNQASSTAPEPTPTPTPTATIPAEDTETAIEECSTDGSLCLLVSLDEEQGLQVKAVVKDGGKIANSAKGNIVFSLATTYDGEIEGFFDADGQYHDFPDDTSDAEITVAIANGEAVLYDTEIDHAQFSTNVDQSFVLTARYGAVTVEMNACQMTKIIDC